MTNSGEVPRGGDRIAKLLARAGVASRREIERMIAEGRIARNGVTIDTPATVLHNLAGVTVDGQPVAAPEPTRLFLFNKPTGLLVTERDPKGRPTIYDTLPADLPRVVPVGRLDINTEGLLLLTTDGAFKRELELPATGVERSYRARAYGDITQAQLEDLSEGIEIDGIRYGSIDANIERRTGANVWIEMTLTEGKNREVRNVLEHLGLQVSRLIRTRYGPFILGDMPPGAIGEVKPHDLVAFRKTLKGRGRNDAMDLVAAEPGKVARAMPRAGFRSPPTTDRAGQAKGPARPAITARAGAHTTGKTDRESRPVSSRDAAASGAARRRAETGQPGHGKRTAPAERPRAGFRTAPTVDRGARTRRADEERTPRPPRDRASRDESAHGWTPDTTPAARPMRDDDPRGQRPARGSTGRSGPRPTGSGERPGGGGRRTGPGGRKPHPGGRR